MRPISHQLRKLLILPAILFAIALFSIITMLLWNALMPDLFHLPALTFWQAVGILILARLLFGGARPYRNRTWHGLPWKSNIRDKVSKMTPEERKEFFEKLHKYRHFVHYYDSREEKPDDE